MASSRKHAFLSSAGIKDALFGNQIEPQGADSGKPPKHPAHSRSPSPLPRERIYFYNREDPYYSFTNFYPSPIKHEGKIYPTSEHLFQSLKFLRDNPEIAEYIRKFSDNPRDAFNEAHRHNDKVRSDWLRIRIDMMDLVIGHKFRQHKHLKDELQSTGDAELFEDSPYDAYWGIGRDGTGENQLGKALERLRTTLREEEAAKGAKGVGEGTKGANEANRAMRLNPRDNIGWNKHHGGVEDVVAGKPSTHRLEPGSGSSKDSHLRRPRIFFYNREDPHYTFTNFYPSPIKHEGKIYPTSEHLFQSLKFLRDNPKLAEHIRKSSDDPRDAFNETHRYNDQVRSDWLQIRNEMMDIALSHKFRQHKHLRDELLSTGNAELIEDSPYDAYWGIGKNGMGENQLGKALERLRFKLSEEEVKRYAGEVVEDPEDIENRRWQENKKKL